MAIVELDRAGLCYQCAKCSAGCPVSSEMDMMPHQIIHLAALGMEEKVLSCKTLWICAGCYTCAVRCPNDINVTAVMDELRQKAIGTGVECPLPQVEAFHKAFLRDVARRGRVHEPRMMAEYNLATHQPFKDASLAPKLFFKGRLGLLPPRAVSGFKQWMKKLWRR